MKWKIRFTDGKHVQCLVWDGRDEYEDALYGADKDELASSYACFKASPVRVNSKKVGEIHLVAGNFGAGAVAHECLHAVLHWLDYLSADYVGKDVDEEALCRELGHLVSEFWTYWYVKTKEGNVKTLTAPS